jgi:hypothetical protein
MSLVLYQMLSLKIKSSKIINPFYPIIIKLKFLKLIKKNLNILIKIKEFSNICIKEVIMHRIKVPIYPCIKHIHISCLVQQSNAIKLSQNYHPINQSVLFCLVFQLICFKFKIFIYYIHNLI